MIETVENTALTEISKGRQMLANANEDIQAILTIRDMATAAQIFANAQGFKEAAQEAKIFQLQAERKAGQWLAENVSAGNPQLSQDATIGQLPEGIDKYESSRWQLEAALPDEQFNEWVDTCLANDKEISASALRGVAKNYKQQQTRSEMAELGKDLSVPDDIQLFRGDFRELGDQIPDNSIDLIFTDPPYDRKSIPLYEDLAKFAARILKPGGSLITYAGHYAVGEVYNLMLKHLRFWWLLGVKHSGGSRKLIGVNVIVEWKPLLWFVKGTREGSEFVRDMLTSDAPDKTEHEWQQGHTEADYYIEHLTPAGGFILDPFAGSGTTLISALKLGRKSIGYEVDEERYSVAKQHINNKTGL